MYTCKHMHIGFCPRCQMHATKCMYVVSTTKLGRLTVAGPLQSLGARIQLLGTLSTEYMLFTVKTMKSQYTRRRVLGTCWLHTRRQSQLQAWKWAGTEVVCIHRRWGGWDLETTFLRTPSLVLQGRQGDGTFWRRVYRVPNDSPIGCWWNTGMSARAR